MPDEPHCRINDPNHDHDAGPDGVWWNAYEELSEMAREARARRSCGHADDDPREHEECEQCSALYLH